MNNGPIMTRRGSMPNLPSREEMLRRLARRPVEPQPDPLRQAPPPASLRPRAAPTPSRPGQERDLMAQSVAIYEKTVEERDHFKKVASEQERELRLLRARADSLEADKREAERERDLSRDQATAMLENLGSAAMILSRALDAYHQPVPPKGNMRLDALLRAAEEDGGTARVVEAYAKGSQPQQPIPAPAPAAEEGLPAAEPGSMDAIEQQMAELLRESAPVSEPQQASEEVPTRFQR